MASRLARVVVHHWLRRMNHKGLQSRVRAVFLGDFVSTSIVTRGAFEAHLLEVLERQILPLVPKDSTCLDIGGNIGNHACFFADHFDRVVSFEPNPLTFRLLEVNAFGLNIETVPQGLSDQPGKLWFKQNTRNRGASTIVENEADADFQIEVTTLDDFAQARKLGPIGLIKIDVEGHELNVLKGARKTLEAHKPLLAMEGLFARDPQMGADIEDTLREMGYGTFYRAVPRAKLSRWLSDRGHVLHRGPLVILLPEHMQRDARLEEVAHIRDRDHELFIAAPGPLELPEI